MRIKSITISGLRSFGPEPVTLDLGPRTVLIGPHGAGKSTVIMALEMLHAMASGSIHSIPCLQDDIQGDAVPDITVRASMEGNVVDISSQVDIVIAADNKGIFGYSISSLKVTKHEDKPREFEFHGRTGWQYKEQAYEAREELDALLGIHKFCDPSSLYPSAFFFGGHPLGEQLADEFKKMYGDFKGFEKVNQLSMVPTVGIRETNGRLTLLRHLSVGMRTYLGLLAFLLSPMWRKRVGILILEEPDAGLHPDLLHHLAGVIKRASEHCQIVMTTNNPGMLSEFSDTPEDVVVVERPFDYTELKRLERAPLEHWLKDYSLGHAWESGAIGGRMEVN